MNIRGARVIPKLDEKIMRRWLRKVYRGPETDCWVWFGARTLGGYGQIRIGAEPGKYLAHRVGYRWYKGPIRKGHPLLHTCDNPSCVNPDHLKVGTFGRNTWDMIGKGRHRGSVEVVRPCPY